MTPHEKQPHETGLDQTRLEIQPISTKDMKLYLEESRGLERDFMAEVLSSKKMAWRVAIGSSVIASLTSLALIGLLPLKTTIPYVLRVDNTTGHVDIVTTLKETTSSYGEVVDSYFLNQYVLNREGYDYNTLQTAYNTTALLSEEQVQQEYYALFEGKTARDKVLKDNAKIIVHVRSITPMIAADSSADTSADISVGTAVVRFSTHIKHRNGQTDPLHHWIATIGYGYKDASMTSTDRLVNPLGFQVVSYRVDPETLTS